MSRCRALAWAEASGRPPESLRHVYLGPRWTPDQVAEILAATGLQAADFRGREEDLLEAVVDRLERGEVIGWFPQNKYLAPSLGYVYIPPTGGWRAVPPPAGMQALAPAGSGGAGRSR